MVPAVALALWAAAAGVIGLDAELVVRTDGVVEVTETVVVRPDESSAERAILVRKPLDDSEGIRADNPRPGPDRVWKVSNVAVSRPDGSQVRTRVVEVDPGRVDVFDSTDGWDSRVRQVRIYLDDAESGTYVLRYDVEGALTPVADGYELAWDVHGARWGIPGPVAARVSAPNLVTSISCTSWHEDTRVPYPCKAAGTGASVRPVDGEQTGLTIVARFPSAGMQSVGPHIDDTRSRRAPVQRVVLLAVVGAFVVGAAWIRMRRRGARSGPDPR